jgi:hypothetical protein
MSNRQYITFMDFSGGLNDTAAPDNLEDNELVVADNIDLSERGGFSLRKGYTKLYTTSFGAYPISRIFEWNNDIYFTINTSLYKNDILVTSTLATADIGYIAYQGKLYIVDGSKYYQYDGTTFAEVTPDPDATNTNFEAVKRCKYLALLGNRLFAAGDSQNPNLLYFSELGKPNFWKGTSVINVSSNDNDVITGLTVFAGALLVFKKNSIWAWFGTDPNVDVKFVKIPAHTGALNIQTVVDANNTLIYFGRDGLYALSSLNKDYINSELISVKVTNLIKSIVKPEKAVAVFDGRRYLLAYCDDATLNYNNKVLVFDTVLGAFTRYTNIYINTFCRKLDGTLLFGSAKNDGYIYKFDDVYNDDGNVINMRVVTKPYALSDNAFTINKLKRFYLSIKQDIAENKLNIKLKFDYMEKSSLSVDLNEAFIWGVSNWGNLWGWSDLVAKEWLISFRARRVQVEFTKNYIDQPLTVYGIGFAFIPKRPKGVKI